MRRRIAKIVTMAVVDYIVYRYTLSWWVSVVAFFWLVVGCWFEQRLWTDCYFFKLA